MKKLLVAAIVLAFMVTALPAFAENPKPANTQQYELNLGFGHPLFGTHTESHKNNFDGADSWLVFASVDKEVRKNLRFGMMYNFTRMRLHEETTTTETDCNYPREYDYACSEDFCQSKTTTDRDNRWVDIHVFGPYVQPEYHLTKWMKMFGKGGIGGMYMDGPVVKNAIGLAWYVSAGLTFYVYENMGVSAQYLVVNGLTNNVHDVDYRAPVLSFMYRF